jgi:hypothetical protein
MTKDEIRNIFLQKQNNGEFLTQEEEQIALQFFSVEELNCLAMPIFNHESCFHRGCNHLPRQIYIENLNTSSVES